MTKDEFKKKLDDAGDAVITYRSQNSRRLKYNICTMDFSTPYIKGKKNRAKKMDGGMMEMPRAMYKGGGICKKGKGRAYGKNS